MHPESTRLRRALTAFGLVVALAATSTGTASAFISQDVGTTTASPASSVRGQKVSIAVTIPFTKSARATGTVDLTIDSGRPISVPLNSGAQAIYNSNSFAVGTHEVSSFYNGDAKYAAGPAGTATFEVTKGSTTVATTSGREPVPTGGLARLTSQAHRVGLAQGALTGTATFTATKDGSDPVTLTLPTNSVGTAYWQPALANGLWSVTSTWNGNDDFAAAGPSAPVTVTVGPVAPVPSTIDQQFLVTDYGEVGIVQPGGFTRGLFQTFTAGRSGVLDKVSLPIYTDNKAPASLSIKIVTTSGDVPTSTVLGSTTWAWAPNGGFVDIPLTVPAAVTAGTKYAIVVEAPTDAFSIFLISANSSGGYPGGADGAFDFGTNYNFSGGDMDFKTWVRPS